MRSSNMNQGKEPRMLTPAKSERQLLPFSLVTPAVEANLSSKLVGSAVSLPVVPNPIPNHGCSLMFSIALCQGVNREARITAEEFLYAIEDIKLGT